MSRPPVLDPQVELARISHRLLAVDTEAIPGAVERELAAACALARADECSLHFQDPDHAEIVFRARWRTAGPADEPLPIDRTRHPWALTTLLSGHIVHWGAGHPLPAEARREEAALERRGVRALLAVPMRSGGSLMGAHVFERRSDTAGWTDDEIATLRTLGEVFVSALKRWAVACALRESEERFRTITEHATELIAEFDTQARYRYVSPSYETLLGHAPGSLLGRNANDLIHPDDVESSRRTFVRAFKRNTTSYSIHRLRNARGEWRWFENSGQAYWLTNGERRFVSIGHDITERVAVQKALERQLDLERTAARLSRRFLGVVAEGLEAALVQSLEETAALAGAERAYLARFPRTPADRGDFHEWHASKVGPLRPTRRTWTEERLRRGETLCYPDARTLPDAAAAERESVLARGVASLLSIPVHDGDELVGVIGFESMEAHTWDEHEIRLLGLIGQILTTAIQRSLAERALRDSQLELLQSQKLEAVGRLAGGIAHDFNNLLTVILGFSRPMLAELPAGSPHAVDLAEIHAAAERAAALTRQLLTFSRRQPAETRVLDLDATLARLRPMLERMLGQDVVLTVHREEEPTWTRGDVHQIEQVVVNLAANARDAMPEGGELEIATRVVELDAPTAARLRLARAARYVALTVADSGQGMDAGTRRRIFDPFFTTKPPGEGTGLGLSIVYSIVEQAGGTIEIDSEPGVGSRFQIWLPHVPAEEAACTRPVERTATVGHERVLFVEDEPGVRRLGERILSQAGYRVVAVADAAEALDALRGEPPFEAVVTDVIMPGMGGGELARRIRAEQPDVPILFVSGHPGEPGRRLDLADDDWLPKPYSAEALLDRLRALIDGARAGGSEAVAP